MRFADVVLWKDFPFQRDGIVKRRWFVCLGEFKECADPFDTMYPILMILGTTTTQLDYYADFEKRNNHPIVRFSPDETNGFEAECILDLSFIKSFEKGLFAKFEERGDIEVVGHLSEEVMKKIYAAGIKSSFLSHSLKDTLYKSYTREGFVGLEKPAIIR